MAQKLNVVTVTDGKTVDTVTLVDGELTYDTGRGRHLFDGKLRLGATPTEVFEQLSGWSNGYIAVTPA